MYRWGVLGRWTFAVYTTFTSHHIHDTTTTSHTCHLHDTTYTRHIHIAETKQSPSQNHFILITISLRIPRTIPLLRFCHFPLLSSQQHELVSLTKHPSKLQIYPPLLFLRHIRPLLLPTTHTTHHPCCYCLPPMHIAHGSSTSAPPLLPRSSPTHTHPPPGHISRNNTNQQQR